MGVQETGGSSFDPLTDGGHGGMGTEKLSQRQSDFGRGNCEENAPPRNCVC